MYVEGKKNRWKVIKRKVKTIAYRYEWKGLVVSEVRKTVNT